MIQASLHAPHPAVSAFLPHGYCYLWNRPLLLTHLVSDLLIGISYVVISVALAYLVHRARRDIPFSLVFIAFGLFIVTCGLTHFMEVWTLWHPAYWLAGGVKAVTAVASVSTAIAMPFTVPSVLTTLRDARRSRERELAEARAAALQEQNEQLQMQAVELEHQTDAAQRLAEELEAANEQLRLALVEARESRAVAEEALRAKDAFLATMSHELRTPLNAIIGYEQLLVDEVVGPVNEVQRRHLQRIHASASHLVDVVGEILSLARLEAGRETVAVELVQAEEVVHAAAAMVEPMAADKQLRFDVAVPSGGLELRTDPMKLRQILLNLLSNAVKFTDSGQVGLEAYGEGEDVCFVVRDTGMGISPEDAARVFDPFWQVDQSSTRRYGGSGLGLTVSRGLAHLLGGGLTLESTPGQGTTFVVRLPRSGPAAHEVSPPPMA